MPYEGGAPRLLSESACTGTGSRRLRVGLKGPSDGREEVQAPPRQPPMSPLRLGSRSRANQRSRASAPRSALADSTTQRNRVAASILAGQRRQDEQPVKQEAMHKDNEGIVVDIEGGEMV